MQNKKQYNYFKDIQYPFGTCIYLFSNDFIKMINKSFDNQNKEQLNRYNHNKKAFKTYKNKLLNSNK